MSIAGARSCGAALSGEPGARVSSDPAAPTGLVIVPVEPTGDEALRCVERYYADVSVRFGEPVTLERYPNPLPGELTPPSGVFLVVRLDGEAVGCGALTTLSPGVGYLSRMWVSETARGRGLGRALLGALEAWSRRLGHRAVRLYTHRNLPEAQELYRRHGYREVPPFLDAAPFADLWFEKALEIA